MSISAFNKNHSYLFFNRQPPAFSGSTSKSLVPPAPGTSRLEKISRQYPVIDTMLALIKIPSATPQADPRFDAAIRENLDKVQAVIVEKLNAWGIHDIRVEPNGSMIVRIPGSPGMEHCQPLLLTAHTDIVAANPHNPTQAIHPRLVRKNGKEFIATDGTTTLGADDKGGIAMILDNIARLQGKHRDQTTPLPHVPLEILLSPDEEGSCESLKTLDTSQLKAKHVLVVDEFTAFQATNGLASFVKIEIELKGLQGGHSGNDIGKPDRLNAIVLMGELVQQLGSGVVQYVDGREGVLPLISKNIGLIQGGSVPNAIPESSKITIALRSFSKKAQAEEIKRIRKVLKEFKAKYLPQQPGLRFDIKAEEEYPPWQADRKSPLPEIARQASKNMQGPDVRVDAFHAAAQASILANKKNAYGQPFDAILIGPDIEEAHTVRERVDWKSVVQAGEWLGQMIQVYGQRSGAPSAFR